MFYFNNLINRYESVIDYFEKSRWIIPFLITLNAIIKILTVINYNGQMVSESLSNYAYQEQIESGMRPALFVGSFRSILGYFSFWGVELFNSQMAVLYLHVVISILTIVILYNITVTISGRKSAGVVSIVLVSILPEYHLLTPVLYYQIFEIFFSVLSLHLLLLIMISTKKVIVIATSLILPATIYVSVFFRPTLVYMGYFLLFIAVVMASLRKPRTSTRLAVAGFITIVLFYMFPMSLYRDETRPAANDFVFFGHTKYGGGEGFVKPEYRDEYEIRLKLYALENGIDSLSREEINKFQSYEIKRYIKNEPIGWLFLQVKKAIYTFGAVPIRDNLELLTKGKLSMNQWGAMAIAQLPFYMIIVLFLCSLSLRFNKNDLKNPWMLILSLFLLYLIAATCLYGQYQERYRTVVLVAGIVPIMSVILVRKSVCYSKFRIFVCIALLLLQSSIWVFQAHDALIVQSERYLGWENSIE